MSVSPELLSALKVSDRPELLLSLDENTGISFFLWAQEHHPEYIITTPDFELVRRHIVKLGEVPPGIVVSDKPKIEVDDWFLTQTEPKTKEEANHEDERATG